MLWAIVVLLGLIAFTYLRRFRITILVVTGVVILLLAGAVIYIKAEEHYSKTLVRADQLEFTDLRLGPGSTITGRVKNNSVHTVVSVMARIQVLDCDENEKCEVIADEERDIVPVIPAGQVRDVNQWLYSGITLRGHLQWNYKIIDVRARD